MATTYIPNQPVSFINDLDDCAEPSKKYVQIVDTTDVTQFQFKATYCEDNCTNNLDYEGTTLGDGWASGVGADYCFSGEDVGNLTVPIGNVNTVGSLTYVKVTFLSVTGSIAVWIIGADDSELLGTVTQAGTYEFYTNVSTTNGNLVFIPTAGSEICVFIYSVPAIVCDVPTNYVIQVRDMDGDYVATETTINWSSNYATVSVDWAALGIASGCYTLCIVDPCLNTNAQFDDFMQTRTEGTPTLDNATLTYPTNNVMTYNSGSNTGSASIDISFNINPNLQGSCFKFCFTIPTINNIIAARFRFLYGTTISGWYTTNGTFCVNLNNWDINTPITLIFQSQYNDEPVHVVNLTNMTLFVCETSYTCDCCSTPVKIGSYDCTHLIKSYCDKDALGFKFCNSNFVPQIRLYSKLVRASYMTERESFEDSAGNKNTIYYKRRRSKNFRVDPAVAEYVHDYLSTLSGYDHMFIDNREYFVDDDEYQVSYPSRNDIEAIVSFNVSEKVQLVENKNCGADCVEDYEWQTTAKSCNC